MNQLKDGKLYESPFLEYKRKRRNNANKVKCHTTLRTMPTKSSVEYVFVRIELDVIEKLYSSESFYHFIVWKTNVIQSWNFKQ